MSLERRGNWLQRRINQGRDNGSLSRREANRIQAQLSDVKLEQARLMRRGHGRLRDSNRQDLEQRLDHLRDTKRWARQTDDHNAPWRH